MSVQSKGEEVDDDDLDDFDLHTKQSRQPAPAKKKVNARASRQPRVKAPKDTGLFDS